MLGLFGILNLGTRSLSAQRQGVEVAGQNLANVNNPAYARQRVQLATSVTTIGESGPQGSGVDAVAIVHMRSAILDNQIQAEGSVRGSLESQQLALQYAQASLGAQIDRLASGAEGAAAASGVGGGHSVGAGLSDLFAAFQSLSSNPTSMAERQTLLMKASTLASQFNQIDQRLGNLRLSLNDSINADVGAANGILSTIAELNRNISQIEAMSSGQANDLRDARQQQIELLSKYVKVDVTNGANNMLNISVDGTALVTDISVTDTLDSYDAGAGQVLVRAATGGNTLDVTGGSIHGTIEARDVAVATLQSGINDLASLLITEVNAAHTAGFGLGGTTGENFFNGTTAADIAVNSTLLNDPSLLQAAGVTGAPGDNQVALSLAQLADKKHASLNGQSFAQGYGQAVAGLGQALSSVNTQLSDQQAVENMLLRQRDSLGGVSLDEEMADLTKFQKAFAASARLITTVDEMLDTLVNMKR